MRLTADQRQRYEADGILAIERLIDDDAVAELRVAYIFNFISETGLAQVMSARQN